MQHFLVLGAIAALAAWRYNAAEPFSLRDHKISLRADAKVFHNLNYGEIFDHEMTEGNIVVENGAVAIETGKYTGRSPKDKYIVQQEPSASEVCCTCFNAINEYWLMLYTNIFMFQYRSGGGRSISP